MKLRQTQRHTRQLQAVWEAVAEGAGHPTAEEVFHRARQRMRTISRGTVYRNLQKLVQQGRVLVIRAPDGVQHFDASVEPHDHFACCTCGCLVDVPLARELDTSTLESWGYSVVGRQLTWIGICADCRAGDRRAAS